MCASAKNLCCVSVAASCIAGAAMSSATRVGKNGRIRKQPAPARCGMNATSLEAKTTMTTRKTKMVFSTRLLQFLHVTAAAY
jgi:hypothetical protein